MTPQRQGVEGWSGTTAELDDDDLNKLFEASEVIAVARVEGQLGRQRCRRDKKVHGSVPTRFAASRHHGRNDTAVRACRLPIEGERIKCCLGALKAVLSPTTLIGIRGRMGPSRELRHAQRADSDGDGKLGGINPIEVDENRRVEQATLWAWLLTHEASRLGSQHHPGPLGSACSRRGARS